MPSFKNFNLLLFREQEEIQGHLRLIFHYGWPGERITHCTLFPYWGCLTDIFMKSGGKWCGGCYQMLWWCEPAYHCFENAFPGGAPHGTENRGEWGQTVDKWLLGKSDWGLFSSPGHGSNEDPRWQLPFHTFQLQVTITFPWSHQLESVTLSRLLSLSEFWFSSFTKWRK